MRGSRDYDVAPSLGPLSEGAVCPTGRLGECAYFRSRDLDALRKGSPGGWCSAQRIKNLYDCRWQSYRYYGVTPYGVTDEVEGNSIVPSYGDDL